MSQPFPPPRGPSDRRGPDGLGGGRLRADGAAFARAVADNPTGVLYVFDLETMGCAFANRAAREFLGHAPEETIALGDQVVALIVHSDDLPRVMAHFAQFDALPDGEALALDARFLRHDGAWRWMSLSESVFLRNEDGGARQILGVAHDVTERERLRAELERTNAELEAANGRLAALAATDGLTGLTNQGAFLDRLAEECDEARRLGRRLSLVLLDVDRFKEYNDAFGHPAGDEALASVAEALRSMAREGDVAARYGGEEFALLMPSTEAGDALLVAERARAAVGARAWPLRAITVSAGVAEVPRHADGPEALLRAADRALYAAKEGGRDRVCTVVPG